MAYEQLREQLKKSVGEFLFDLASSREYPIHPFVGLWGFTDGFVNCGVEVLTDKSKKEALFRMHLPVDHNRYLVSPSMSYSGIISGAGSIPGSISAYEESIFDLLIQARFMLDNKRGVQVSESQEERLSVFFSKQKEIYFAAMQSTWRDLFRKFHENVLVGVDGTISGLAESTLFDNVLTEKDFNEYTDLCMGSDTREIDDFEMYFNDLFLQELKLVKGYPIQAPDPRKIDYSPLDCMVHGSQMHWRNLENLVV
jgi:hypothetical protein